MGEAPILGLLQLETWASSTGFKHGLTWGGREHVGGDTGPSPAAFWLGWLLISISLVWAYLCAVERARVLGSRWRGVALQQRLRDPGGPEPVLTRSIHLHQLFSLLDSPPKRL